MKRIYIIDDRFEKQKLDQLNNILTSDGTKVWGYKVSPYYYEFVVYPTEFTISNLLQKGKYGISCKLDYNNENQQSSMYYSSGDHFFRLFKTKDDCINSFINDVDFFIKELMNEDEVNYKDLIKYQLSHD